MDIHLYAEGTRDDLARVLDGLSAFLGREFDATVWRDYRIGELADGERWEGPVTVEIYSSLIQNRAEALPFIGQAIEHVDPEHRVITGGDVFMRPIDD